MPLSCPPLRGPLSASLPCKVGRNGPTMATPFHGGKARIMGRYGVFRYSYGPVEHHQSFDNLKDAIKFARKLNKTCSVIILDSSKPKTPRSSGSEQSVWFKA